MAYTDGNIVQIDYEPTDVETAAAICTRQDRIDQNATALLQSAKCPAGFVIDQFGVNVVTALTNAHATNLVLTLQTVAYSGASAVAAATITLPAQASEVTLADIVPSGRTQAQAVAAGAQFTYEGATINVPAGGEWYLEITVAAGAAGGRITPWVLGHSPGFVDGVTAAPCTPLAS